jgi:hypothetical protein
VRIANEQYDAEMSPRLFWFEPTLAFSARLGKTIEAFLLVLHVVQFIEAHLVVSRYDWSGTWFLGATFEKEEKHAYCAQYRQTLRG